MSFLKTRIATAALLFLATSAQKTYVINPDDVPLSTRSSWCTSQIASCPLLCLQNKDNGTSVISNDCDPETLSFDCLCSNNLSPNITEYSQTIPYFICVEYGNQCVANCGIGATACQSSCRTDNPCGAQNPQKYNLTTTTSATTSATSAPSGVVQNGFETTAAGSSTNSGSTGGAQTALDLGRSYGLAMVFTGIFAGFALIM